MIQIIKKEKRNKKTEPYYKLIYNYMIGDANGETTEECDISIQNPYVERYVKLLNSLKPTKGTWGIRLNSETLEKHYLEKQITKDDYQFLLRMCFEEVEEDVEEEEFEVPEEFEDFSYEFYGGVRNQTEYSFLVFLGVELKYIDEYGKTFDTKIV